MNFESCYDFPIESVSSLTIKTNEQSLSFQGKQITDFGEGLQISRYTLCLSPCCGRNANLCVPNDIFGLVSVE